MADGSNIGSAAVADGLGIGSAAVADGLGVGSSVADGLGIGFSVADRLGIGFSVADGSGIGSSVADRSGIGFSVADGLGIGSSVDAGLLSHGLSPSLPSDRLVLLQGVNPRHGAGRLQSPFEVGQPGMARAVQGGPAAAVASLDLPFNIPYSSRGATEFER